jgi:predicted SnoaL-like aldol condensation-catalyzing enzyme
MKDILELNKKNTVGFYRMAIEYSNKGIELVRTIAKDLVVFLTYQTWFEGEEYVTMKFFRFDDKAKIIEY